MNFGEQLARIAEKNKARLDLVVRKVALDMGGSIVRMSPVLTGRLRANWVYGAGALNTTTTEATDKSGGVSLANIAQGVGAWKPGETMYISCSLPYAYRIEYEGWSKQAPSGMVRTTVANFQTHFARALGETR